MSPRHLLPATALIGAALLGLTGCGSSAARSPTAVITLSNGATGSALPESTVTLAVGQRFAVRHQAGEQEKQWQQTSAGDPAVLGHSGSAVASPCPTGMMGCAPLTDDLYTAKAAGTTTVVWSFRDVLPCTPAGAPQCAPLTKSIKVVVR